MKSRFIQMDNDEPSGGDQGVAERPEQPEHSLNADRRQFVFSGLWTMDISIYTLVFTFTKCRDMNAFSERL
jgi:hypothetical protein